MGKEQDNFDSSSVRFGVHKDATIPEHIEPSIQQALQNLEEGLLELPRNQPEYVRQILDKARQAQQDAGQPLSSPEIVALYASGCLKSPLDTMMQKMYAAGHHDLFNMAWDLSFGVGRVISRVYMAVTEIRGESAQQLDLLYLSRPSGQEDTSESIENYLHSLSEYTESAQLLISDPTGYTLVAKTVEDSRDEAITNSAMTKYIVQGAEMAQRLYMAVYPLTEQPPSTSSHSISE